MLLPSSFGSINIASFEHFSSENRRQTNRWLFLPTIYCRKNLFLFVCPRDLCSFFVRRRFRFHVVAVVIFIHLSSATCEELKASLNQSTTLQSICMESRFFLYHRRLFQLTKHLLGVLKFNLSGFINRPRPSFDLFLSLIKCFVLSFCGRIQPGVAGKKHNFRIFFPPPCTFRAVAMIKNE